MDFDYIGEMNGCKYWHYVTSTTTYVICSEPDVTIYRAFIIRINIEEYLLHDGKDCRVHGFSTFAEAQNACLAKLKALRGV